MATDSDESGGAPRPKRRRELLALVRPDKPWADLTDAEIDELASRLSRQMTERIRDADERNAR